MYITKKDFIYLSTIVILFFFLGNFKTVNTPEYTAIEKETKTTTEFITKKQLDSLTDYILTHQKSTPQRIIISNDHIKPITNDVKLTNQDIRKDEKIIQANKYLDTIKLKNGTIYSEIYADKIYGKKFSLATNDTIVTQTTFEKLTIVKSSIFYGMGTTLGLNGRIKDIEATATYFHKGRFYIEGGLQYDIDRLISIPPNQRTGIKLKVGFNF